MSPLAKSRAKTLAVFALALAVALAYVVPRFSLDSELASLVPATDDSAPSLRAAHALATGPSASVATLEVRGENLETSTEAMRRVIPILERSKIVASIASRDLPLEMARISALIDAHPEALGGTLERLDEAGLEASVAELRDFVSTPFAADQRAKLPRDPMLARLRAWDRLREANPPRSDALHEGHLLSTDGKGLLETIRFEENATTDETLALLEEIERAAGNARVRWSGVKPITARATASIRGDVERVSTFSTIGVFLLLGIAFGALRYVAIAALPLAAATVASVAAGLFFYGRIHGIALAFAGAMVGVVVDYVEHFLAHRMMSPVGTKAETILAEIRPSLRLAALTTLVGVSGFAFAGYPGFREITAIAGAGVLAGLFTTTLVVARIVGPFEGQTRLQVEAARASRAIVSALRHRKRVFASAAALVLIGSSLALSSTRVVDDPAALSGVPSALLRDDAAIREQLGSRATVLVATSGSSCDEAAQHAEQDLENLRRSLPAASIHSPVDLAPSRATQEARIEATRAPGAEAYRRALESSDFASEAFEPFYAFVSSEEKSTVDLEQLAAAAPLLLGARVVHHGAQCLLVSQIAGSTSAEVASTLGVENQRTVVVDSRALQKQTYARVRRNVLTASLFGLVAVFLLCALRYRNLRRAIVACAPAWLSALAAIAIASCFGHLDLLHGLGALLVVSMGTDFGIFFVDTAHDGDAMDATFASVVLSALTTILSFGVLGLSRHPALASLGATASIGVTLAVLLAPAALAFDEEDKK